MAEVTGQQFSEFWSAYPRKVGKGAAEKAYLKALDRAPSDAILAGLIRWCEAHSDTDPQFIPHPATWLNARRWEDEEPEPVKTPLQRELAIGGRISVPTKIEPRSPEDRPAPLPSICLGWNCPCNPDRDKPKPESWPT